MVSWLRGLNKANKDDWITDLLDVINLLKVDQLIKRGSVERELLLDDFEILWSGGKKWYQLAEKCD